MRSSVPSASTVTAAAGPVLHYQRHLLVEVLELL